MAGAISVRARLARGAAKAALLLLLPFIYLRHFRLIRHFLGNFGRLPNLSRPSTKHEKFLWRKIFDRNPMYRLISDKLLVRSFIKARCPDLDVAEIIWIGSAPELIPDRDRKSVV